MSNTPEILIDENLSWRVARGLRALGYSIQTIQEAQLAGRRDDDVFRYAQKQHLVILTRDGDFESAYPPPHQGIIVVRANKASRNANILDCLALKLPIALSRQLRDHVRIIECE